MPKKHREHLVLFSQLIEITCEKYPSFREQVECSDAEIFSTIPYLLVLKSSLDVGKEANVARDICERFFPSLSQDPILSEKFAQLIVDFEQLRLLAADNFFDFYNKIE